MQNFVLKTAKHRRIFNPASKEDVRELKYFIQNKHWANGCPFYLEDQWIDIPGMCLHKYTQYMLAKLS